MFSNKKCKILISILIIFTFVSLLITGNVYAQEIKIEQKEYSQAYKKWMELSDEEKAKNLQPFPYTINIDTQDTYNLKNRINTYAQTLGNLKTSLPTQYKIPNLQVKDQMQTNSCWAFALNSAIESTYLKQTGKSIDLSERHMEYATAKTLLNEQGNKTSNPIGFNREVGDGGNEQIGVAYATNGTGLVLEEDMPFENNENLIKLSEVLNKQSKLRLSDVIYFSQIHKQRNGNIVTYSNGGTESNKIEYTISEIQQARNKMKQHIYNYGAITANTYIGQQRQGLSKYANTDTTNNRTSYYCDNTNDSPAGDHAITIVGWDDNYSKENFKEGKRPTSDGAYICLNSYGENLLPGEGYIYVSYEDVYIEIHPYGIKDVDEINGENIYQHDFYGGLLPINMGERSTVYSANVFKRDITKIEYLTQISIQTLEKQEIEIYVTSDGKILYTKNLGMVEPGYYTIKLEEPVLLTSDKFDIRAKYTSNKIASIAVESNAPGTYDGIVTSNAGESYISLNGQNWEDLKGQSHLGDVNVCLKAFTKTATSIPVQQIQLNKQQTILGIQQTETLIATILPENATNKNITWESSDPSIATVDNKGKVTGISEGTVQITAKTEDGQKTATCEVTVQKTSVINISSTIYTIQGQYIYKVKPNTTKQTFINNIQTNGTIKIYNKNGKEIEDTEKIATGMILHLSNGNRYEIVVTGDLDGDRTIKLNRLIKNETT